MATYDFLEAERRERPRVAVVAGLAALLLLGGQLLPQLVFGRNAADNALSSALSQDEHRVTILVGGVLLALGLFGTTYVVDFLLRAASQRLVLPSFVRPMVIIAGLVAGGFTIVFSFILMTGLNDFASNSTLTFEEARAITDLGPARVLGSISQLLLAGGVLIASMQAMRAGLLTRFLGILGIVGAVLFVVPLLILPVVQAYWLLMLAVLLWNIGAPREPPAWQSGEAVPWPSSAEVREERVRAAEARRGGDTAGTVDAVVVEPADDADDDDAVAEDAFGSESAGQRRKRKKRR